ncbi:Ubiquitin conjugation factor E4 A [Halotydeus destructor]|nr:Ubiquitin conjugation factor E4 A [Halotydeus destructor]
MGRLARFHNVIGKDTIDTLAWITADIKTIFCNHNMVDRVAGMLNYFLKYLVGPKKTDYKVKQMEDFEFKPADIVHDICLIYTHLSVKLNPKDKEFCIAVANDGRSYSEELLPAASHVLIKTGKSTDGLAEKVVKLSAKVQRLSKENEDLEVNVDDVPDDYLDPIMSTLMTDPVKLPSGYIVDRSTIARHLLSDQTDPFTRAPLTMENVVPDTELKQKIDDFVSAYQANRSK